jgi:hypothetical protein
MSEKPNWPLYNKEREARLRLENAAPELLAALEAILQSCGRHVLETDAETFVKARAAIAKARE